MRRFRQSNTTENVQSDNYTCTVDTFSCRYKLLAVIYMDILKCILHTGSPVRGRLGDMSRLQGWLTATKGSDRGFFQCG